MNKKIFQEFRTFALRGNVMDMAVGIIIGAAFGKIISSFVTDILMPPIGLLVGGIDFARLSVTLRPAIGETPALTLNYGLFLNTVIDFILIAFSIFLMIKAINKLRKAEAKKPAETPEEIQLLREIRDSLKKQS
jgi:large conductance mechanosensitive channel